jgi:hypothetical protein
MANHNPLSYGTKYYQDQPNILADTPNMPTGQFECGISVMLANYGAGTNVVENWAEMEKLFAQCNNPFNQNYTGFSRIILGGAEYYLTANGHWNPTVVNQLAQFIVNAHLRGIMVTYALDIAQDDFPLNYAVEIKNHAQQLRRFQCARQSFPCDTIELDGNSFVTNSYGTCAQYSPWPVNSTGSLGFPWPVVDLFVGAQGVPPGSTTGNMDPHIDGSFRACFDDVLVRAPYWTKTGYLPADAATRCPDICNFLEILRTYLNLPVAFLIINTQSGVPVFTYNGLTGTPAIYAPRHADMLHVVAGDPGGSVPLGIGNMTPFINAVRCTVPTTGLPTNPAPLNVPLFFWYDLSTRAPPAASKAAVLAEMNSIAANLSAVPNGCFAGFTISDWTLWNALP